MRDLLISLLTDVIIKIIIKKLIYFTPLLIL